nr:helix-turn-helix domain-containing protein [Corallococcus exiguus]
MASVPTLDEAARLLGIDASTLWRKRKKYESET